MIEELDFTSGDLRNIQNGFYNESIDIPEFEAETDQFYQPEV